MRSSSWLLVLALPACAAEVGGDEATGPSGLEVTDEDEESGTPDDMGTDDDDDDESDSESGGDDDDDDDDDTEETNSDPPNWHWVLWDGDGEPVKAVVNGPHCGTGDLQEDCLEENPPGSSSDDFPCVSALWVGGKRLGGAYELADGRPERCTSEAGLEQMSEADKDALDNPPYLITLEP